jgi:hypothetical protein
MLSFVKYNSKQANERNCKSEDLIKPAGPVFADRVLPVTQIL